MRIPRPSNRREFLKLAGLGAAGAVLVACGQPSAPPTTAPAAKPTEAPKPAATTAPAGAASTPAPKPTEAAKPTAAQPTPAAAAKPATGGGVEVRLHVRTGSEQDTLEDVLPEFEKAKGIKVKVESFPGGEYFQKLQVLLAGGNAGDVIWGVVYTGQGLYHAASGIYLFVDDLVKAEKFDLEQYYAPAIEGCKYKARLFGLPFKLHPGVVGIYYNADVFKGAGVNEPKPKTHEELLEVAKAMTKTEGGKTTQWGFLPSYGNNPHFYIQWARAWGGDILSADGTKATVNSEATMEAYRFVYDTAFTHKVAPNLAQITNSDTDQLFISGVVGMYQSGSWTKSIPTRIKDRFQVKDVLMPKGPSGKLGTWMVTDFIGINAKTKSREASWELDKLLCGKEVGIRLGEGKGGASGTSGGRKDVFESDRLKANPLHQIWIDAVALKEDGNEMRIPANFRGDEFNKALSQRMGPLWLGDAKPTKEFFEGVNRALQDVLDKPAP